MAWEQVDVTKPGDSGRCPGPWGAASRTQVGHKHFLLATREALNAEETQSESQKKGVNTDFQAGK